MFAEALSVSQVGDDTDQDDRDKTRGEEPGARGRGHDTQGHGVSGNMSATDTGNTLNLHHLDLKIVCF